MSVENTVDYLGYALTTTGTPLADRPVTLKRVDTSGTVASTVTDANGMWRFDDIAPSPLVRAEISAGTTPQIAVKSVFSGDVYSLYVREKLVTAPAAVVGIGGSLTVAGTLAATKASTLVELGSTAGANTPGIDFHSSGNANDYDSRILAGGGSATAGQGTLSLYASTVGVNAALMVTGQAVLGSGLAMTATSAAIELGSSTVPNTPLIDFHSINAANDYDVRLIASGGATGNGGGHLDIIAASVGMGGVVTLQVVNVTGELSVLNAPLSAHVRILVDGGSLAAPEIACISDPDTGIVFEGSNVLALVSGGVTLLDVRPTGLEAPHRILVDGGSMATPEVACISDPNTGIGFNGSDQMSLVAGGNEVARVWMNGANSQFSTYGAETYIGTNKLMLNATVMTTASSVTGVIRKIQVCDASGATVGWVPVYGAAG